MTNSTVFTVQNTVQASLEKVWKYWTEPDHIVHWNNASDDWHTPKAVNDLRPGGRFVFTMVAKDGSFSFDFSGVYSTVNPLQYIAYTLDDDRNVEVRFPEDGNAILVTESFETENTHSHDMQRAGWQAILDNFKRYVENQ